MRNLFKQLATLLLFIGLFCSCSKDSSDDPVEPDPVVPTVGSAVAFTALLGKDVSGFNFVTGDAVGIFAVKSTAVGAAPLLVDGSNYADNIMYKVNAQNQLVPSSNVVIKQPVDNSYLGYVAVYPYSTNINSTIAYKSTNDIRSSNLMVGKVAVTEDKTVSITFVPIMSKLDLTLVKSSLPEGADPSVNYINVKTTATVDVNKIDVSNVSASTGISVGEDPGSVVASKNDSVYSCYLPKQVIPKDSVFATIEIAGKEYPVKAPGDIKIGVGVEVELPPAKLDPEKHTIVFTSDIIPWEGDGPKDPDQPIDKPVDPPVEEPEEEDPLSHYIPEELLEIFKEHISIYYGNVPPVIEGQYLSSKHVLDYSSIKIDTIGKVYADLYMKFMNQNTQTNMLQYEFVNGKAHGYSNEVYIMGKGNYFTVFFEDIATNYDTWDESWIKTVTLISGYKTSSGIKGLQYGFIVTDKKDPDHKYMAVGQFRVFKDGDGVSGSTSKWPSAVTRSSRDLLLEQYSIK